VTEHPGTVERQLEKLRRDFGEVFLAALADPETVEILLNPDGTLWQERLGEQPAQIGSMTRVKAESVLRTIAACVQTTITREKPTIECELPLDGSRFAGQIPPVVSAPTFAVRKRASRVFSLDQYVEAGILTPKEKDFLCGAIEDHRNVLVSGGTGSGKTTFVNALIGEVTTQYPAERLIIIEDTGELQCAAANYVQYHTSPERTMTDLARTSLRMRPDRILVGEVRGPEALDLLMAWNTGHEGGIATLHANNAVAGLARLVTLVSMNPHAPRFIEPLVGEAVDVLVHIERKEGGAGRIVREVLAVEKWDVSRGEYVFRRAHLTKRALEGRAQKRSKKQMGKIFGKVIVLFALLLPVAAHAATGGGGLPWETPLQTLSNSISGPLAYGLSLIGLVVSGGVLIFMGGELNHFARVVVQVVLVISFIIAGKNTMSSFGWGGGAEIGLNKQTKVLAHVVSASQDPQSGN